MSNRYKSHIIVLPEDDADQQIVNGIKLSSRINDRAVIVDKPAKGWLNVVTKFTEQIVPEMQKYLSCYTVLLIDFDCKKGQSYEPRLTQVKKNIPDNLKDRVFVLGVLSEPEKLRSKHRMSLEIIGKTLVQDCPENKNHLWNDELLTHNEIELNKLLLSVRSFLFNE
jgi:hypothetical protein